MFKKFLSLALFSFSLSLLFAANNPGTEQSILRLKSFDENRSVLQTADVDFSIGSITYANGTYDRLITDMDGQIRLIGAPDLPSSTMLLAVPSQGNIQASLSYSNMRIESDVDLTPFQPVQLEAQGLNSAFQLDREIYEQDAWFPENPVILHERVTMRDLTLVGVEVTPFQYNPARKELRVYEGLEVTVDHDQALEAPERPISRFFEPFYQSMVPNSSLVLEPIYQTPSVLFIHPNNSTVELVLQNLADWRHEKGFEVHMASTTIAGTSNSAIKSYIQTAYNTWENPPEFVVLVGDAGGSFNIPTWTESWSNYNGEGDVPYVHLAGADYIADAFVGRLPFGSTTEFTNIIAKILNYEKNPAMTDPTWFTRALLVGDQASSGLSTIMTNRNINEYTMAHGFHDNIEVYSGSFVNGIANGINAGVSYFNYRGWLGMSGWGDSNTSALTNGSQLPFVTILTCGTGSFTGDARSEKFLRVGTSSVPKGGIAAVGTATSGTHTLYNNCVSVGIYHGIFQEGLHYAGAALQRGRFSLNQTYPSNSGNYVEIFSHWNNLMGDPSLELWTGVPQNLTVDAPSQLSTDSQFLDVSVLDALGFAAEKAWVSLTGEGVFVTSYTDEDGMAVLALPEDLPSDLKLTVTRHNAVPVQIDIDVNDAFPVSIDAATLVESSGNGDDILNPGETATFDWTFSNQSDATIYNVMVAWYGEDESNGSQTYDSLLAGASVDLMGASMDIPTDFPGMARFDVMLSVDIDGAMNFTDHRRFDVIAPYIEINQVGETGMPPYSFDPGEISDLVLYSKNIGTLASSNLHAVIRCAHPDVEIIDSTAVFMDVAAGELTDNTASPFQINVTTQVTVGVQIPFQVEFTDDMGFVETRSFLLPIGTPGQGDPTGPDAAGYFCYSDQDLAYALAPTYDWIEIAPGQGGYPGTLVNLNDNGNNQEDIETVALPFDFGFYGIDYNEISICSNGYIALGESQTALFRNYPVPGPLGPSPMIAAFWDDLVMGSGDVYTYFNSTENYFVIQYHNMQNAFSGSLEKFQVILYNPDYYGSTDGNGDIKIQYHTYANDNAGTTWSSSHGQYSTTGLEDHTGMRGLQYTYNNSWAETAHPLGNGSALLFTTRTDAVLPCPGWARGDINHDGQKNVQDLVLLVQALLGSTTIGECEFWSADMSADSSITVSDIVLLVDVVLGHGMDRVTSSVTDGSASFIKDGQSLYLRSETAVEAFAFTLQGDLSPALISHEGLTVVTEDFGSELRVLGYWTGPVEKNIEIMRFGSGEFQVSETDAADGYGVTLKSNVVEIPQSFTVNSVYPNPFNPTVNISYSLPLAQEVSLKIFNALGQELETYRSFDQAGTHVFSWDGTNASGYQVSSGVYFARISSGETTQMIKLTLLR
jgi:hypothetical protein